MQSQVQGSLTDMSSTSDSLASMSLLNQSQRNSSGHMGASQGLHAHLEDSRIRTELRQEPRISKHVLQKCQDNDFLPDTKKVGLLGSKVGEGESEYLGVSTSKAGKKSHPVADRELKGTFLSLSQNE